MKKLIVIVYMVLVFFLTHEFGGSDLKESYTVGPREKKVVPPEKHMEWNFLIPKGSFN